MSLRELIEEKGWTNEAAAQRLNVSVRTLYHWIKGTKKPNWDNIYKICDVFGCQLKDIN